MSKILPNKIYIYEDKNLMNKYETKEDFFKEYESI